MNRAKKEEKRKHDEARNGLTEDEVLAIDLEDENKRQNVRNKSRKEITKQRRSYGKNTKRV